LTEVDRTKLERTYFESSRQAAQAATILKAAMGTDNQNTLTSPQ
jgi:hypothetical protein